LIAIILIIRRSAFIIWGDFIKIQLAIDIIVKYDEPLWSHHGES
jgi:hypothetical protein